MNFETLWLNYNKLVENDSTRCIQSIVVSKDLYAEKIIQNAVKELKDAFSKMFDRELVLVFEEYTGEEKNRNFIRLKKVVKKDAVNNANHDLDNHLENCDEDKGFFRKEAYSLTQRNGNYIITGSDEKGVLYGVFAFLRKIKLGENIAKINEVKSPVMPFRMLNHWDNMDGSIERGYSGDSFFFENNEVIVDERTKMYARLASSAGINAVVINNVNVKDRATYLITDRYFDRLNEMAGLFAEYGIQLFLSLNYAAPMELGELNTADPLDEKVKDWWMQKIKEVYSRIQNLGGFLIKADSEGRPGPFTYGRTHADGANMLADALAPFGGIIIWRCFVYNCMQDWRDTKTDRARSGYDHFIGLDGKFRDNVILQIKNGPMDFQVREPVHPLFGGLKATNQMLELQIAQEYTGQQKHVCYLLPMFKEILGFRTYAFSETTVEKSNNLKDATDTKHLIDSESNSPSECNNNPENINDTICDIISGKAFHQTNCGMAAVANTGNDENWTGHDLAAANLYGFGRLCFEPELSAEEIAREWIILTFGRKKSVLETISDILMKSWLTYEKYNAPLGIGWMVTPHEHYGPNVDGYEYDRWGTYHRADHLGIGVDRSHKGTGYAQQYNEPLASIYDSVETCPDELLLFFHHVPYTHILHSGKSVLQHIYDTHFEGAEEVEDMVEKFLALEGSIEPKSFERMKSRFLHQREHAKEWRDQINSYFYRKTGVDDIHGRKIY